MKISKVKNNVKFGLKIVENDSSQRIRGFYLKRCRTYGEMCDVFNKISEIYNDDLSLEFSDYEERKTEIFGVVPFCNIRIFGKLDTKSKKNIPVNVASDYKYNIGSPYHFNQWLNAFIKQTQKSLDNNKIK